MRDTDDNGGIMAAHSHSRGWPIRYIGETWRYEDTNKPDDDSRPCVRCGRMPTPEGYDACLGYVDGAIGACCGHGVDELYVMYPADDNRDEIE